jgi:hypothetical protein
VAILYSDGTACRYGREFSDTGNDEFDPYAKLAKMIAMGLSTANYMKLVQN